MPNDTFLHLSKFNELTAFVGDKFQNDLIPYHTIPTFNDPEKKRAIENIVGKGENAGNQHFLLFPQCFLPVPPPIFNFKVKFIM